MVALLYLKHAHNESDESVLARGLQDVYFQFFSGQVYFEPRWPCDQAQISRFRRALGPARVKVVVASVMQLLAEYPGSEARLRRPHPAPG